MLSPHRSALSKINRSDQTGPLKILTLPTHEGYAENLSKTGHEFHMIQGPGIKTWDHHTRKLPHNHFIYLIENDKFRGETQFDLFLAQERHAGYGIGKQIKERYNIPLIMIDHTEPPPNKKIAKILSEYRADVHVFITAHNQSTWGHTDATSTVIPHGINTDVFAGYEEIIPRGISCVNQFATRDVFCGWNLWNQIKQTIPLDLVGDNPGLSDSINQSDKLAAKLASYRFFLNTSQLSPCPLSLLEAMAVGLPVVSTAKQEIPNIITHGVNGFLSNEPEELVKYCNMLIADPVLARTMGSAARQTILDRFSISSFVQSWNKVFYSVLN